MNITLTKTVNEKVEIQLPIFKRKIDPDGWTYYLGILNDETAISFTDYKSFKNITVSSASTLSGLNTSINWPDISEEEFLEAHDTFIKSLSLTPQLSELEKEIIQEMKEHDDLKNINI